MFEDHQPRIAEHAASPDGLLDVLNFVQATIQRHFIMVPALLRQTRTSGIQHARGWSARQRFALEHYARHKDCIFREYTRRHDPVDRLAYLVSLPGLGLPKAGFVCQLAHGDVGCLDVHNLKVYGLDARDYRTSSCSTALLRQRAQAYAAVCLCIGTAQLWDNWCALVARRHGTTPDVISMLHVWCVIPEEA